MRGTCDDLGTTDVRVVIPAHNEALLLGRCLASVSAAAVRLQEEGGGLTTVLVVADRCTDGTLDVVSGAASSRSVGSEVLPPVATLVVDAGCVGRARDLGVRHVLDRSTRHPSRIWVAMTDADSEVAPDWLTTQLGAFRAGQDLWVGRVHPDPSTVALRVLREWEGRHRSPGPLHIHGANLGFSASVFLRVGGFAPLAEHEDVAFVHAAIAAGASWAAGADTVRTSGRTHGRTPGGFAGYLRALTAELDTA